jgi:hypothetical protein
MGVLQGLGNLPCNPERFLQVERSALDAIGKRRSFHELQHERLDITHALDAVNRSDVRVIERGEQAGFTLKAASPFGVQSQQLGHDLERHVSAQCRVRRAIHLPHPAGTEQTMHDIRAQTSAVCHATSVRESRGSTQVARGRRVEDGRILCLGLEQALDLASQGEVRTTGGVEKCTAIPRWQTDRPVEHPPDSGGIQGSHVFRGGL